MKRSIKFLSTALLFSVFSLALVSCDDDDDKRIDFASVPQTARTFVDNHFSDLEVWYVEKDGSHYEVTFRNRLEVDFDSNGNWIKIEANYNPIPASVLLLLDSKIVDYINKNYSTNTIEEIEKKYNGYIEVELNNDIELLFNSNGEYVSTTGGFKPTEEMIPYDNLPQVSKDFISTYFPNFSVRIVEKDRDKYEVEFNDGTEIDFYLDGSLKSVESPRGIPDAIISPIAILDYVKANYQGRVIEEYSKLPSFFMGQYANGYKIELLGNPEIELFFNKEGVFLSKH